jgi:hypothetical protein
MKKPTLLFLLILFFAMNVLSQTGESVLVKTGRNYTLNNQKISRSKLNDIYSSCPEALKEYKLGKTLKTSGNVLTYGGLAYVLVASQVVRMQRENDYTDWFNYHSSNQIAGTFDDSKYSKKLILNAGIGVGISAVGIICMVSAPGHFNKAVKLYNLNRNDHGLAPVQLNFMISSNQIGIKLSF